MITIRVRLFALVRESAGTDLLEIDLPEGATVADLRERLFEQFPSLGGWGSRLLFAVGTEYSPDNTRLSPDSDVACIPPVSGG